MKKTFKKLGKSVFSFLNVHASFVVMIIAAGLMIYYTIVAKLFPEYAAKHPKNFELFAVKEEPEQEK
jgi:hypothetical protein